MGWRIVFEWFILELNFVSFRPSEVFMVHPDQLPAQLARRFRPEWRLVFFSAFGFGLLAHFYKMANWLPNWDSKSEAKRS